MRDDFPVVSRPRAPGLPPRAVQVIRCAKCGAEAAHTACPSRLPPHTIGAKFSRQGWKVSGAGRHLCPDCRAGTRRGDHPQPSPAPEVAVMAKPAPAAPSPPASAPAAPASSASARASRAIVDLYVLLEDKYDRTRKVYAAGYDDARVAAELGLAVAVVSERRERDFGPLAVDTTREDLAKAIADARGWVREINGAASAVDSLAVALNRRLGDIGRLAARLGVEDPDAVAKAA